MSENNENIIIITQGEYAEFDIFLEKESGLPRPIDLTDYDLFTLCLPTESGDCLNISQTENANGSSVVKVSPDVLGQLHVTLGPVDSAALKCGFGQDMDLEWDISGEDKPKRKRLDKALNVSESCCPD